MDIGTEKTLLNRILGILILGIPMPVISWLAPLAPYAWFVAFAAAFGLYVALMRGKEA